MFNPYAVMAVGGFFALLGVLFVWFDQYAGRAPRRRAVVHRR